MLPFKGAGFFSGGAVVFFLVSLCSHLTREEVMENWAKERCM